MGKPIEIWHPSDPRAKDKDASHRWPFCYLHGEAEEFNERNADANGWDWRAPDLFEASEPMPDHDGEFYVVLYGKPVLVILSTPERQPTFRRGRAALANDHVALAHCRKPQDWR